ncbi:MAG: hypothetical protein RIQ60_1428 [Pseudomonadota bacterium]|jgi:OOP family OmpA-OmpF porin
MLFQRHPSPAAVAPAISCAPRSAPGARRRRAALAAGLTALALGGASLGAQASMFSADQAYAGGNLGAPHYADSVNGVSGDGQGLVGKLYGGYQLLPSVAVEAGIARLGHIDNTSGTLHSRATYVDAVGALPLYGSWSLLGRAGLAHVGLDTSNGNDSGNGLKLGLGAQYDFKRQVALRGEWERYLPDTFGAHPAIDQFSVGVKVGF